jgi:hypothetical protein
LNFTCDEKDRDGAETRGERVDCNVDRKLQGRVGYISWQGTWLWTRSKFRSLVQKDEKKRRRVSGLGVYFKKEEQEDGSRKMGKAGIKARPDQSKDSAGLVKKGAYWMWCAFYAYFSGEALGFAFD